MPKRTDISSILIIGSGPIVIGQACEFDYAGAQACKALRQEGYQVILANSNPATIMTDPNFSDVTYIEPLNIEVLEKIIEQEKPDTLLPTLGGQTGLNLSLQLHEKGILKKHQVEMIGACPESINCGENRELFRSLMLKIGEQLPQSGVATTLEAAYQVADLIGKFPLIIRPSFTLGGLGGGIAYNREEFQKLCVTGLEASLSSQILVEEGLVGWKEYEMEVMRDHKDQCVLICSIENIDPMGIHTGDSITVAPAMTLSNSDYQAMREASFRIMRAVGVETGGSNIQFAINPQTGRRVVIEMNPRVSRSSALASKATGFPIAKIAAKLAVGYALEELPNDITKKTPASFEPSLDYVVTKIPRFAFEKFRGSTQALGSSMRSVGETMALGSNFKESFQKAIRGLELGVDGFCALNLKNVGQTQLREALARPTHQRLFFLAHALKEGMEVEVIASLTHIDPWFIYQFKEIVEEKKHLESLSWEELDLPTLKRAKAMGFGDSELASIWNCEVKQLAQRREAWGLRRHFCEVDTCAGEFAAHTPYYYSTWNAPFVRKTSKKPRVMIIGGGPNRIGQGIEFDYCCVHASYALRQGPYETVMVNSNPETVSTDYDSSDALYFEPLSAEHVLDIYQSEQCVAAIVQFGGQTPLNLAKSLEQNGVCVAGTSPDMIERAENRENFQKAMRLLNIRQPKNSIVLGEEEVEKAAAELGFPLLLRPSFVLGGRGMLVVYSQEELRQFGAEAFSVSQGKPVLMDQFLEDGIEIDVDAVCDGKDVLIGGILEHIEKAGVHGGDASMVLPAHSLSENMREKIIAGTRALAFEFQVKGLMNVQWVVKGGKLYILELNPRASRTVPFVSKATDTPLAQIAAWVIMGKSLRELKSLEIKKPKHWSVKASVFPFMKFEGATVALSPEMRSTGEVMGIDKSLPWAIAKAQMASHHHMPQTGTAFLSVCDKDKDEAVSLAESLLKLGFQIYSTSGTAKRLSAKGLQAIALPKLSELKRPNVVDLIKDGKIDLVINTATAWMPRKDENRIRGEAVAKQIALVSDLNSAFMMLEGLKARKQGDLQVRCLQSYRADA